MKKKILVIYIGMLVLLSVTAAAMINVAPSESNKQKTIRNEILENTVDNNPPTTIEQRNNVTSISIPKLKFFIYDGCTKNITNILKKVNEIFKIIDGEKNVQFDWNGKKVTLGESNRTKEESRLLNDLKKGNCSEGINVVICRNNYTPLQGLNGCAITCYCSGTRTAKDGGIIIVDTCNETQMAKTLAHELLHALGLSHDEVKWKNPATGKDEGKPINSTIRNATGGEVGKLPASRPVPPHGYGYYDRNGDCNLTPSNNEIHPNDGWDIDGDCNFSTPEDKKFLLWGRADRDDEYISEEQCNYIYNNANLTPGSRYTTLSTTTTKEKKTATSTAIPDILNDVNIPYIDLMGSIGSIYWEPEPGNLVLSVTARGKIPSTSVVSYNFYLDTDNSILTGCPSGLLPGADFWIQYKKTPTMTTATLYEWNPVMMWWKDLHPVSFSRTRKQS